MFLREENAAEGLAELGVRLRHRIGTLQLDVEFTVTAPWTILFGPSGSGKTTILRAIAGLLKPDFGHIVLATGGSEVVLLDTEAGVFVPTYQRRIGMAAQQPNIFPHKTVAENLRYGAGYGGTAGAEDATHVLDEFGLAALAENSASRLSGGEAQRLNLARALAAGGTRILLFDEPFTGMDGGRRDVLLPLLRGRLAERGTPVVSVTHDVAEAYQLCAEVIKITEGRVAVQGPVEQVLADERMQLLRQLSGPAESPG